MAPATEAQRYLTLFIETDRLLRKPSNAAQIAKFRELEQEFRAKALDGTKALDFVCLEGPVSVHLHVHAPELSGQPLLPPVVKAYLDALEGIAYVDDRQISHLTVRQDALDHPMMQGFRPDQRDRIETASVFVEVEPLKDYTAGYDRAFRSFALTWRDRRYSPWRKNWTVAKEAELRTAQRELRGASDVDAIEAFKKVVHMLEEERLCDGTLADIDRPGPLPQATRILHRFLPAYSIHWRLRQASGAAFLLLLRGQEPGSSAPWKAALQQQLENFRATRPGLPLSGFVGLDIAVRGASLSGKDLDNLAHSILGPFESALCVRRGTVSAYRAYSAEGEPKGIQVRVLNSGVLLSHDIAIGQMRSEPSLEDRVNRWLAKDG